MSRKDDLDHNRISTITPEDRLLMSAPELAIADAIAAAQAKGEDPFGDENEVDSVSAGIEVLPVDEAALAAAATPAAPTPPAAEVVPAVAADAPPAVTAPAPAPTAVAEPVAAPVAATPPAPVVADVDADDPAGLMGLQVLPLPDVPQVDAQAYETNRNALETQIAAIDDKWEAGEIDAAARRAQIKPLSDKLDEARIQFAASVGDQRAAARQVELTTAGVIGKIREAGKRDGLDYSTSTTVHSQQFDNVSTMLQADPANAALTWVQLAHKADVTVRAMNGIKAGKAAAPSPAPTPAATAAPVAATPPAARPAPPEPPKTLRELPAAGGGGEHSQTIAAKLMTADAIGRDAIYNKMTPAQRAALIDD